MLHGLQAAQVTLVGQPLVNLYKCYNIFIFQRLFYCTYSGGFLKINIVIYIDIVMLQDIKLFI